MTLTWFTNLLLPQAALPEHFLDTALRRLRWSTLVALWAITLMTPHRGTFGLPDYMLVLTFGGYYLLADLARRPRHDLHSFAWVAILDLPVAGLLYALGGEGGGPLFVLFFLAADSAAVVFSLRGTLVYTTVAAVLVALVESTLPMWMSTAGDIRALAVRLVMLALMAAAIGMLTRRLGHEYATAARVRDEAERLEQLDRLRADFISTVSHDLRTPLTAAWAGSGLLEASIGASLSADQRVVLGHVRRNIESLNLLVDDLLAFNQLEAGVLVLDTELVDVRDVVTQAIAAVHALVNAKGQSLSVDTPTPLALEADPRWLRQILVNLLANAHRHTPCGTHIQLAARSASENVLLTISDDGPGIPADELENIFRRYYRVPSAPTADVGGDNGVRGHGGSGLGLTIARRLVELHGGRIWAESRRGDGTLFSVLLPSAIATISKENA